MAHIGRDFQGGGVWLPLTKLSGTDSLALKGRGCQCRGEWLPLTEVQWGFSILPLTNTSSDLLVVLNVGQILTITET